MAILHNRQLAARSLSSLLAATTLLSLTAAKVGAEEMLVPSSTVNSSDVVKLKAAQLPPRPKVGLALGGGGARGAAELGVMEVFEKEGLKFDYIAGTSIGSIVGGLYDAGVPLKILHEEFESGRAMKHFMPVSLPMACVLEPFMLIKRALGFKSYDGLYPGVIFEKYLRKMTPPEFDDIQKLKTPYAAVTLNLVDGKPYMIRGGSLVRAMRCSSAVPGLRYPIAIGEQLFVDGGVACNVPVKQCREMGADIVIAVNIDEPFGVVEQKKFKKLGSVAKRMVAWDLQSIDKPQEELADIVIHPDTAGVTLITTSRVEARKAIEAGHKAAEAAMPAIREKLKGLQVVSQR